MILSPCGPVIAAHYDHYYDISIPFGPLQITPAVCCGFSLFFI